MAKPIKATPVVKGKDAVRFWENFEKNKDKKATTEEIKRIKDNFEKLKAISKF
jgi:hypothetical protein